MLIQLEDCDLSQTVLKFAQNNSSTGKISLKLYGEEADNWINGKEKLPYVQIDGMFQWNISIKDATLYDLGQTFLMDIHNDTSIEFDEVQNWDTFETDIQQMNNVFCKYLKRAVKDWRPKEHSISVTELIRFIKYTGVYPAFVLDAMWIRDSYSVNEFASLFGVKCNQAEKILEAAGYQKKSSESNYRLIFQRKESVKDCLEKGVAACDELGYRIRPITRWKKSNYKRIIKIGETIADFGRSKDFFYDVRSDWSEPAYSKRKDWMEKIFSGILILVMMFFVIAIVAIFTFQMLNQISEYSDSLYSFWGSIAGSMIAGLITIFTTYLIIRRGYKMDYHQERMAKLPFFDLNIVATHFSTENLDDIPKKVQKIMGQNICYSTCLMDDAMLIEIKNVGNGPAFQVTLEGLTPFYEEPRFQSIVVEKSKYIIVYNRQQINCKLKFYDIYGNYYYQAFDSESNFDNPYIEINSKPPELILRTSRIRYIQ